MLLVRRRFALTLLLLTVTRGECRFKRKERAGVADRLRAWAGAPLTEHRGGDGGRSCVQEWLQHLRDRTTHRDPKQRRSVRTAVDKLESQARAVRRRDGGDYDHIAGPPRTASRRALERGNLVVAELEAREVGQLDLAEALELTRLLRCATVAGASRTRSAGSPAGSKPPSGDT
jgi:hypothetical protein